MKLKNIVLTFGLLVMIIACGETAEEKAMREFGEEVDKFGKEMNKLSKEWNQELEKSQRELEREMEKWESEYGY